MTKLIEDVDSEVDIALEDACYFLNQLNKQRQTNASCVWKFKLIFTSLRLVF